MARMPIRALLLALAIAPEPVWGVSAQPAVEPARLWYLAQLWDTDRGLPDYAVNGFIQTPDGYLWLQTFEGLARFDGAHFEILNHRTAPDFPGTAVTATLLDRHGQLWAGTDHGIACLRSGRWQMYPDGGKPATFIGSMAEDREGVIWAMSGKQLLRFVQDRFEEVPLHAQVLPVLVRANNGDVWIHDERFLARREGSRWAPVPLPATLRLHGAGPSRDGGVWVAGTDTIEKFRDGRWSNRIQVPDWFHLTGLVRLLEDSDGNLWAGDSLAGLMVFRQDGRVLRFTRADGLPSPAIRALFEDREKNVWVGTHGGGMIRLKPRAIHLFNEEDGLGEIMLNSVTERARGGVLVATYGGGLFEFDPVRSRFGPPAGYPWLQKFGAGFFVNSAIEDRDGAVWAAVSGNHLFRIDRAGMNEIPTADLGLGPRAMFQDSRGTIWIGVEDGVIACQGGRFTRYSLPPGLPTGPIAAIAEDQHGEIWAGGTPGLFRNGSGKFERFPPAGGPDYGPIISLSGGKDGLWIGLGRGGLYRLRNSTLTEYGPTQGLPAARITAIVEDNRNRLWMATFRDGLLCVPIGSFDAVDSHQGSRLDLIWLRKEEGLGTNQFRSLYQPSAWQGRDGRLWFATLKGLVMVDPQRVRRNRVLPPILIEAVGYNGKRTAVTGPQSGALTIPPGSRNLEFFYTSPSFTAPERIRFQYQLEGLDPNWVDTGGRSVVFGQVKPGDYVFRVKAANESGLWNPHPAAVRVHVAGFIWQTWWFQVFALVSMAVLAATAVYRSQSKKLRQRTGQLRREQELRRNVERLQDVLKVSEEKFAKAFNASPSPLSLATLDEGRFVDVNSGFLRITGLRREEIIGATYAQLGIWEGAALMERLRAALANGSSVRGLDVQVRNRNGQHHQLIVSAEAIELGGVRHLLAASDDITDRLVLEQRLNQAQKMESIGRLAGGVAHDFNNLLTVINGYSDLLLRRSQLDADTVKRLRLIRQAGTRAGELTQQLLAISRKQAIVPRGVDLNVVVGEAVEMLNRLLPENIEMVTRLEEPLGLIMADSGQIHQVLLNLALNARDAMPEGGSLIVETANVVLDREYCAVHAELSPGPFVLLKVTDQGIGMDEAVRAHVFEPFFTTKGPGVGTGLGLASVYGIVRQHSGGIWVYSEPGKGTSFKIYFSRVDAHAPLEAPAAQPLRASRGTETILLAEDRDDVRMFAKEVLESHGYRVLEAENGAAALLVAARNAASIDLLLTDVVMPGMDGPELHNRLTRDCGPTKVLYMSGYSEGRIARHADSQPAAAFVEKPLTPDRLLAKVREVLEGVAPGSPGGADGVSG